jgi:hypothetical protein
MTEDDIRRIVREELAAAQREEAERMQPVLALLTKPPAFKIVVEEREN